MRAFALLILIAFVVAPLAALAGDPVVNQQIYGALNAQPEIALHKSGGTAAALSTTPVAPFANLAATPENKRVAWVLQDVVVINLDATGAVCLKAIACSAAACSTTPTSGNFDCLGTNPGILIPAGATRSVRFTGEVKVWAVASEASTDAQLERTMYFGSAQAVR